MSALKQQQCQACRSDAPRVSGEQLQQLLVELPEWQALERDGIPHLVRRFKFKNFVEALAFTNRVGEMAEQQGHHPDLLTSWGCVEVRWWTHKIKGLHQNDFICAARCDSLYLTG